MAEAASIAGERCWICGSTDTTLEEPNTLGTALRNEHIRITDARYGTTVALLRCHTCGFLFAARADIGDVEALYAALADVDYVRTIPARRRQMERLLRQILARTPDARTLLDVGAAAGLLVSAARARGLDAVGVEPSRELVDVARRELGVDVINGSLPNHEIANRRFDVVTLIDVIEHVSDPIGLLRAATRQLETNGTLVVVTPDARSVPARVLGARWWHRRPAHIGYFDRDILVRAAAAAGLRVVATSRPRWYLPVGYLTERVAVYVPHPVARFARALLRPVAVLARIVLPLNLRDSLLVYFTPLNQKSS